MQLRPALVDVCTSNRGDWTSNFGPHTFGITTLSVDANDHNWRGNIEINTYAFFNDPATEITCHEIGHGYGLAHNTTESSCINLSYNTGSPSSGDFSRLDAFHSSNDSTGDPAGCIEASEGPCLSAPSSYSGPQTNGTAEPIAVSSANPLARLTADAAVAKGPDGRPALCGGAHPTDSVVAIVEFGDVVGEPTLADRGLPESVRLAYDC